MNRRSFIGAALGSVLAAKLLPLKQGVPTEVRFTVAPMETGPAVVTWRGYRWVYDESVPNGMVYILNSKEIKGYENL